MKISRILTLLAFVVAGEAEALTYTDSAAFAAATAGQTKVFDDYSGLAAGTTVHSGDTINGVTYSFATAVGTDGYVSNATGNPGDNYLTRPGNSYVFQPGDAVTFSFAAPVKSFGLHVVGTAFCSCYLLLPNNGVLADAVNGSSNYDWATRSIFLGVNSDTSFTSVTLTGGYVYEGRRGLVPFTGWGIGDVSYGVAPVPEPETYALMLAGLGLLGAIVRRRRA